MTHQEIIEDRAYLLMDRHGLIAKGWRFAWNKRARAYGVCRYREKRIELSQVLCLPLKERDVVNTLLHEIAHALTPGHKHDQVWQEVFIAIGGDGKPRSSYENTPKVGTWGLYYGDMLVKTYCRKPTEATRRKVRYAWLPSIGMAETLGKLELRPLESGGS